MLTLRLFRVGKKNQPSFKIVVTDKRHAPRAGRFTEEVGFYNPVTKEKVLSKERVQYWLSKGVQPSPTVYNLLVKEGILAGKKIPSHKKSKKPIDTAQGKPAPAAPVASATAAPAASLAPAPEPSKETPKAEEKPGP